MNRSALKAPAPRGGGVSEKGSALHITTVHRRLARASPRGSYRRVVRAWPFTNSVEFVQHVFDYLLRCLVSRRQQQLFEFLLAPKVAVTVLCLRDSIGVRHHNVIGFELERSRRELRVRQFPRGCRRRLSGGASGESDYLGELRWADCGPRLHSSGLAPPGHTPRRKEGAFGGKAPIVFSRPPSLCGKPRKFRCGHETGPAPDREGSCPDSARSQRCTHRKESWRSFLGR